MISAALNVLMKNNSFPIEEPSPLFYDSHIDYDILEYGCKGNKK